MRIGVASCSHVGLLGELDFSNALASSHHVLVLDTHNTATPVSAELLVVVELFLEGYGELLQVLEVLFVDFSQSDASSGLHVAEFTEVSLAADERVRDVLSAAESRQMNNALNRVDIVSHDDQLGLALFDERGNVVETELDVNGLGSLAGTTLLGGSLQTELLLLLGLWHVLSEELEELGS